MRHILRCVRCGTYTMKGVCCGEKALSPRPPKFSPEDKYAGYRRKAKQMELVKGGLL